MANDPAFLFYPDDFIGGTFYFTDEQIGKYVRALCVQHSHGFLTPIQMNAIVGNDPAIREKFIQQPDGNFMNERMAETAAERKRFSDGQSKRAKKRWEKSESDEPNLKNLESSNIGIENGNTNVNVIGNGNGNGRDTSGINSASIRHRSGIDPASKMKTLDLIDRLIYEFQNQYIIAFNVEYNVELNHGKERAAAGKLLNLYKKQFPGSDTEMTFNSMVDFFSECMVVDDPWIRDHMSLSIIVSKFNEINKLLKNGKSNSKSTPRTTPEQFADIMAKHLGRKSSD
jgi:hypothetical protein